MKTINTTLTIALLALTSQANAISLIDIAVKVYEAASSSQSIYDAIMNPTPVPETIRPDDANKGSKSAQVDSKDELYAFTLDSGSDPKKIETNDDYETPAEQSARIAAERPAMEAAYNKAFRAHVSHVIAYMSLSFVQLNDILVKGDPYVNEQFNLNPAGDAKVLKAFFSGVFVYERKHPELGTECMWGLGGQEKFLAGCDELMAGIVSEFKHNHHSHSVKLSKAEIKEVAHQIDPHFAW